MSGRGKGRGRPNRGGGRFNHPRGRGRGGRGRGRGGKHHGGGGGMGGADSRKGGAHALADGYAGDAVFMPPAGPKSSRAAYRPSSYNPTRRSGVTEKKVTMQRLHMTSENQDMVRGMLKLLHEADDGSSVEGDVEDAADYDYDEEEEGDYDELDWRAEDQYWLTGAQLQVQDATPNLHLEPKLHTLPTASTEVQTHLINNLAANKLQRYGFEKARCEAALKKRGGDVGKALEYLISQCFDLRLSLDDEDTRHNTDGEENSDSGEVVDSKGADADDDVCWSDITEQRTEEMIALESIYGEQFSEKIPNQVWSIALKLPHLNEFSSKQKQKETGKQSHNVKETWAVAGAEVCRFYLKGFCKFGSRCYNRHELPFKPTPGAASTDATDNTWCMYTLEIRFPKGNRYPYEPPYVAFCSTNPLLSAHVCLNISSRLVRETKELAKSCLPAVFTLVSVLDDEQELQAIAQQSPSFFSLPEPIIYRRQASAIAESDNTPSVTVNAASAARYSQHHSQQYSDVPREGENGRDDDAEFAGDADQADRLRKKYGRKDAGSRSRSVTSAGREANDRKLKDKFRQHQSQGSYQSMLGKRKKLPAWNQQDEILAAIKGSQVTVVSGMTGCGKTTQVPQFILDAYLAGSGSTMGNIICTQPRRISAISVAERVAEERVEKVGGIVGYQIRLESVTSPMTRLLFCTTGILLRRLEGDALLSGVTHVIIDEVHERSEESDFLMMILRDMLPQRKDLRVLLMSATLNAELFSEYFGDCPVINIPGRTFPVAQYFLEDAIECTRFVMEERSPYARPLKRANAVRGTSSRPPVEEIDEDLDTVSLQGAPHVRDNLQDQNLNVRQLFFRYSDYKKSTVKAMAIMDHEKINYDLIEALIEWIVSGQHQYPAGGAILVFLPGMAEITTLYENLLNNPVVGSRNKHKFRLIPLHSSLSSEDQHAVFSRPKEGVTKIVIATNIAETSITIEDVVYVLDAGRMKEKRYDSSKGMESLETVWVSQANAQQRKGRAGRVASGVCFHLFTGHRFEHHLREQPIPEIQRAPLEQIILKVKLLHIFRGMQVEEVLGRIIEGPSMDSIQSSIVRLQDLGALDMQEEMTPLGYHLAMLPVDVRIGKLMLFGAIFRCLDPALTIAATLSFKSPFVSPFDKRDDADKKKTEFAVGSSDHLTMLRAYRGWCQAKKNGSYAGYCYCQENFLSIKTLQMLASMKRQFTEQLSDIGFVKDGLSARRMERMSRDGSDGVLEITGPEANCNSENLRLVAAILVAALYPNVVQVMTPESKYSVSSAGAVPKAPKPEELKFKTKNDGYVHIHPSSVNFQVRHYESPYLVYHEKVKTSKVYIRDCTMVSVYPLLLFGGGSISIDLVGGNFVMSVDEGWIRFMAASHQVAELVRELRLELDQLLKDKIENPNLDLCTCPRGSKIINTIVQLISTQ